MYMFSIFSDQRDAFNLFDKRGDGKIDSSQLGDILRALGLNPTQADVAKIRKDIDPTGEKRISFEEFLPIYHTQESKRRVGEFESFVEGFKVFDRDGSGMISSAEIRHMLSSLGERLTDDEIDILLQGMEDNFGKVNYEEFIRKVIGG
ncbi:myosin-2 essential light chain-like [Rhopilema esculentum]|uniref:myosin-2 essential light chain-like n=1 Tax=Rhopilema esculentum TaxID=499914 RepID=UPI0031CF831B